MSYCFQRELGLLRQRSHSSRGRQKPLLSSKWSHWSVWVVLTPWHAGIMLRVLSDGFILSCSCKTRYFHIWLSLILNPPAGERKTPTARKSVRAFCVSHIIVSRCCCCCPWHQSLNKLFPLCSWVSCCSAEHINRGGWVRISYLCPTSGAPHPVRLLHRADRNHTGSEWEPV